MFQSEMFPVEVEAAVVRLRQTDQGWTLTIAVRRQGEPWASGSWTTYEGLTLHEMTDVLLESLLALS